MLSISGTVRCWGSNYGGALGNGGAADSHTPVAAFGVTSASMIEAGAGQTCVVLLEGKVKCWGSNSDGQLGDGAGSFDQWWPYYVSQSCSMDIDGNGGYSATTDGLLYARALAGLSSAAVTSGAIGIGATRTSWTEIRAYLEQVCKVYELAS